MIRPHAVDAPSFVIGGHCHFKVGRLPDFPHDSGSGVIGGDNECVSPLRGMTHGIADDAESESINDQPVQDWETVIRGSSRWSGEKRGKEV